MKSFIAGFLFLANGVVASAPTFVHHPTPTEPKFVRPDFYATVKQKLDPMPKKGSARQKRDERELASLQKSRTPAQCDQARSEVTLSLTGFFGTPHGPLPVAETQKLEPFFAQLRNDGDYFIQKLKVDYPRPRPFNYLPLDPCVPREVTGAYPSGHAMLSELFALVLTDLYPKQKKALAARSRRIAHHRVLAGMHHPSDIEAGRKLAGLVYAEMKKSPEYRKALAEAKG